MAHLPRPLVSEWAQWVASWCPALEIFHLSGLLCSLVPSLPHSTTPVQPLRGQGAGRCPKKNLPDLPPHLPVLR